MNLLFMRFFNDRLWISLLHIWVYWAKAKVLAFSSICMQSTLRNWIFQCAFVTRTWFWHRWISLVERYRYLVLDDNLLLWISRISILFKFYLWVLCTRVKTLVFSYKFCISTFMYERILNKIEQSIRFSLSWLRERVRCEFRFCRCNREQEFLLDRETVWICDFVWS